MHYDLREILIKTAKRHLVDNDLAHDFSHAIRVLNLSERLQQVEGGDLDIIVPAALFHDLIVYQKSSLKSNHSSDHSARLAESILASISSYPKEKISAVCSIINKCSYTKGTKAPSIEGAIVQDSDLIESAGAMGIMRTFYYASQLGTMLYFFDDHLSVERKPDAQKYALDFILTRARNLDQRIRTKTGREIYLQRKQFLDQFIEQVSKEVGQTAPLESDVFHYDSVPNGNILPFGNI